MASTYASIPPALEEFIAAQPMFFVATAPLAADGHVNVSPKGLDCLRVLSPARVAYLDITGSGNETAAHVTENGRITLMWCSFGARPMIVRIYGTGRAVLPGDASWDELSDAFPAYPGVRQIMVVDIEMVRSSCGFGVPQMELVEERELMQQWAEKKGPEGLVAYRREKNSASIDGILAPGF